MSKKSYQNFPKPQRLTDQAIESFERSGPGPAPRAQDGTLAIRSQEPKKRLSIDLTAATHRRFKTACSAAGRQMVSELRCMIEARILELEREIGGTPSSRIRATSGDRNA